MMASLTFYSSNEALTIVSIDVSELAKSVQAHTKEQPDLNSELLYYFTTHFRLTIIMSSFKHRHGESSYLEQ